MAVKQGDTNNGIAVHAWEAQHHVNWEDAQVKESEPNTWKRKIPEAVTSKTRRTPAI